MFFHINDEQLNLFTDLANRGSMQSLKYSVRNKVLADFQTLTVAYCWIFKHILVSLDTGLGKTLIATALINISRAVDPECRWIYLCQNNNLKTTSDKLQDGLYNARVVYSNATETAILHNFFQGAAMSADVLVLPYNILINKAANDFLFLNRERFKGKICDESQVIGNSDSYTHKLVAGLLKQSEYSYMLTATPLRISPAQLINQLAILDRQAFQGVNIKAYLQNFMRYENGEFVGWENLEQMEEDILFNYISFTRKDLQMKGNYHVEIVWCDPKPEYLELQRMDTFSEICGDPEGPSIKALVELVEKKADAGQQGLIYVNRNVTKDLVKDKLEEKGIRVGILDGYHTSTDEKKEVQHKAYLARELDVLITNVSTGKDLPSDYICFYELTFDFKQMLGRGERGLQGKNMSIYFILVRGTAQVDYFYENVYSRGVFLEQLLGKDIEELKKAKTLIDSQEFVQGTQEFMG